MDRMVTAVKTGGAVVLGYVHVQLLDIVGWREGSQTIRR